MITRRQFGAGVAAVATSIALPGRAPGADPFERLAALEQFEQAELIGARIAATRTGMLEIGPGRIFKNVVEYAGDLVIDRGLLTRDQILADYGIAADA